MATSNANSGPEFPLTLSQVEQEILTRQRLLASSPRSDPARPARLQRLTVLQSMRHGLSREKYNLDRSTGITNLTEAVLLLSHPSRGRDVVKMFATLASALLTHFLEYGKPDELKSSLKYIRFLRINFHPIQAFGIPHSNLTSLLVEALGNNLELGFGDVTRDMEEMAALTLELLNSDTSRGSSGELRRAVLAFALASVRTVRLFDPAQHLPDQIIQVLRKATKTMPLPLAEAHDIQVSFTLARCLYVRFEKTLAINEYDEAIAIADKLLDAHRHGDSQTSTRWRAVSIRLNMDLVTCRLNTYTNPEYLENSIHRIARLLQVPSPDHTRDILLLLLRRLKEHRFKYFGVTGGSVELPSHSSDFSDHLLSYYSQTLVHQMGVKPDREKLLILQRGGELRRILASIRDNKITDLEAAVERGRTLLPSPNPLSHFTSAAIFADILFEAYLRIERLDYLDEAITAYRDLRKVAGLGKCHFEAAKDLLLALLARCYLFHRTEDIEEAIQLYAILADDEFAEGSSRFGTSCGWAENARRWDHPTILTAYKKAMSLMQETLVFSPTLQTQHFHLTHALQGWGVLPSDYASFQIETGQFEQAVETLERGRALLWSEMRGLRTSTDLLRAADPPSADILTEINRKLEEVTMSVVQSEREEIGDSETGAQGREGINSIGRLLATQRRLLVERDTLVAHIQSLPGLENFLKPPSFDVLSSAAAHGPVIIINQSQAPFPSYILLLLKDSSPSVISTPSDFQDRANRLKDDLLRVRTEKGLDSKDYVDTLASVLADLYELVGKPVIERLGQLNVLEESRVWWCPTAAFFSLPLHAMGPIPSENRDKVYFMDLYITSYTPTLSALIESRKLGSQPTVEKPSLLLVAQPDPVTLPGAQGEIDVVEAIAGPSVTTLVSEKATPTTVAASLRDHRFVHFVCHGSLETGKPFDASFELDGGNLTFLEIVRSQLPAAEFAFLAACHTAELTEDSIADEGLHLAAAIQFGGFRSVVGTLWAMADTDGEYLSKHFYKSIFSKSSGQTPAPYHQKSAVALQVAAKKLRKRRGVTLERWVNFVHYGA